MASTARARSWGITSMPPARTASSIAAAATAPTPPLDDPLATNGTFAYGINDAGQIVGTYNTPTGTHSFLYSGGVFTTIDDPVPNSHTLAHGINNNSQIVGTLLSGANH